MMLVLLTLLLWGRCWYVLNYTMQLHSSASLICCTAQLARWIGSVSSVGWGEMGSGNPGSFIQWGEDTTGMVIRLSYRLANFLFIIIKTKTVEVMLWMFWCSAPSCLKRFYSKATVSITLITNKCSMCSITFLLISYVEYQPEVVFRCRFSSFLHNAQLLKINKKACLSMYICWSAQRGPSLMPSDCWDLSPVPKSLIRRNREDNGC